MKYRYFVSWFAKVNIGDNGLGIRMDGHIENGIFEINHPLTTKEEVAKFTQWLQDRQGKLFQVVLLGFSLMYIIDENSAG